MGLPVDLLRKLMGHVLHNVESAEEAKAEHKYAHK
jgi:hypothetical protein